MTDLLDILLQSKTRQPKAFIQPFQGDRLVFMTLLLLIMMFAWISSDQERFIWAVPLICFSLLVRELFSCFWNAHLTKRRRLLDLINVIEQEISEAQMESMEELSLTRNRFVQSKCNAHFRGALKIVFFTMLGSIIPFGFQMRVLLELFLSLPYSLGNFSFLAELFVHILIFIDLLFRLRVFCVCSVELAEYHVIPLHAPLPAA